MDKKRSYPTSCQKARLVALLEADPQLQQGKFSASFTKKDAERKWTSIGEEINSIPGAKKKWTEWRKTWQDMKATAKKKHTAARMALNATGGGPPPPPLSQEDINILGTMSTAVLVGHTDSQESYVEFEEVIDFSNVAGGMPIDHNDYIMPIDYQPQADEQAEKDAVAGPSTIQNVATDSAQTNNTTGKDKNNTTKKHLRRPIAKRRLEQSLAATDRFQKHFEAKLEQKKIFHQEMMAEMRQQTAALSSIANSLALLRNNNIVIE